jgi:cysteinyl-tRNA synthetase
MKIRLFNTLTHGLADFEPLDPPRVSMYNCGPTVYDYAHIGNFRSFMFADLLRRFLELADYDVHQVMNLTDVGHMTEDQLADGAGADKMQVAVERMIEDKKSGKAPDGAVDDPTDPYQIAQFYIDAFIADGRALGLKVAYEYPQNTPRATDHVAGMVALTQKLIERGHAYVAGDGVVYFSVESYPAYGKLSGNTLSQLRGGGGGRVRDEHQALKRHPADFLLWKPDAGHVMKWESPWGVGYPGWHVECSVMATTMLGRDTIDIHTGAEDNIFPHHECEIAQSCAATGSDLFARFWVHARHLHVDGGKMAKSKGSFHTVRDVLDGKVTGNPVHPAALRFELLKTHYRTNLNFTVRSLLDSAGAVKRLSDFAHNLKQQAGASTQPVDISHPVLSDFAAPLADDLNISAALAVVFKWLDGPHPDAAESLGVLQQIDRVLGVIELVETTSQPNSDDADAATKCQQIDAARTAKDYATADRLRQELNDAGFDVQTTKAGTTAQKRLA